MSLRARCAFVAITIAATAAPAAALAQDPDPVNAQARAAYEEGKIAYRLGDFATAIEQFEKAYGLTENAIILYDVGLSYRRLYTTSNDVGHLRKAVALLENFGNEIRKDASLGDVDEISTLVEAIDTMIANHREVPVESDEPGPETDTTPPPQTGIDPGKKPRVIGSVLAGVGAGVLLTGVGVGVAFGLRGQGFSADLEASGAMSNAMGCATAGTQACMDLAAQQDKIRENGRLANGLAFGLGGGLGVAGLGLVAGGVVLLVSAKKKTKAWRNGPTALVVPTPGGAVISGRF